MVRNRENWNAYQREYRRTHPLPSRSQKYRHDYFVKWRAEHPEEVIVQAKWRARNRDKLNARVRRRNYERRMTVLTHYGGNPPRCARCGYSTNIRALCIDHINGHGREHRQHLAKTTIELWLIQNNFPDGFQVLCANCNQIKSYENRERCGRRNRLDDYIPNLTLIA